MGTINRQMAIRDVRRAAQKANARKYGRDIRSLSVRLDHQQYSRLRQFLEEYQDQTGQKASHQAVLQIALLEYLEQHDPGC